jgi:hypothetical protein
MSLTSTSQTTETTLPSWFSSAQNTAGTSASSALAAAQTPANQTVGAQTIKDYGGASNPFTEAAGNLGKIQSGLMSTYDDKGQLNVNSPLGALFTAQNAKLEQILPQVTAKEGAAGLGGGNFGSLRGQTATGTARAGALTTLAEQQRKAALDAYTQAIQAGQAEGNVGQQGVAAGLDLAKYQTNAPLDTLAKYENILGAMAPTLDTKKTQTTEGSQIESLQKIGALAGQLGLTADQIANAYNSTAAKPSSLPWLDRLFRKDTGALGGLFTNTGSYGTADQVTGTPYDDNGNLNPGWAINQETGDAYYTGT